MISFACSHCDKILKVKDELAGKKVKCPHCQNVQKVPIIPQDTGTVATLNPAHSRAQASVLDDATVPPSPRSPAVAEEATVPPGMSPGPTVTYQTSNDELPDPETREVVKGAFAYEVEREIARGGMGAIMHAVDQDIRREVAVKFLLNHADERQKTRFIEEAQITGQLEHPNIVPIHQLGVHEDGRCFFSMKMVKGRSLAEILKHQAEPGASATGGEVTLVRLLNIMISICNALSYAHSRQVIHRDLKPANIMVGDFGEVYVMDWGLAKVLGREETPPAAAVPTPIKSKQSREDMATGKKSDSKSGDKVTTRGRSKDELTQAGAIMGTPAYMPPEQAQGNLDEVDQRSDIYSLGAILYEMMTLTPPVGRGGDMVAIMMRVVEGKIDSPSERAPKRARGGWIPSELSAIALKALAKNSTDRYQTVETLKRDIELFLEGRSVSAKQDSAWEMFKKLVKRNKGASIATGAALAVLIVVVSVFLKINYDARLAAERAAADLVAERNARREQGQQSAPAFLEDARQSTSRKKLDHALAQVNVALDFDPSLIDALLLKGQLLIGQKKFTEARQALTSYLAQQPGDANVQKLAELCGGPNLDDIAVLVDFSETLTRLKAFVLAEVMIAHVGDAKVASQRQFKLYQQRLEEAWPGSGKRLAIDDAGKMSLDCRLFANQVNDIAPLQGMKLHSLCLNRCEKVRDLAPLAGMPLTALDMWNCQNVSDLTPLTGMRLTELRLGNCRVRDLTPLASMPLTSLSLEGCSQVQDLTPLEGMKLTSLDLNSCGKVRDLSPLRGMKLVKLSLRECSEVTDLAPLADMPLTWFNIYNNHKVTDLGPLQGMKLTYLMLHSCSQVSNLAPLTGMPLTEMNLGSCQKVTDLEPLQGMKLEGITLPPTVNKGLDIVRNMNSLKTIDGKPAAQFWNEHNVRKAGK